VKCRDLRPRAYRASLLWRGINIERFALWDLKARWFGIPLWRLLGGHDPRLPAYAGGIDHQLKVGAEVPAHRPHAARSY